MCWCLLTSCDAAASYLAGVPVSRSEAHRLGSLAHASTTLRTSGSLEVSKYPTTVR
jgi:hypothetical protein